MWRNFSFQFKGEFNFKDISEGDITFQFKDEFSLRHSTSDVVTFQFNLKVNLVLRPSKDDVIF